MKGLVKKAKNGGAQTKPHDSDWTDFISEKDIFDDIQTKVVLQQARSSSGVFDCRRLSWLQCARLSKPNRAAPFPAFLSKQWMAGVSI